MPLQIIHTKKELYVGSDQANAFGGTRTIKILDLTFDVRVEDFEKLGQLKQLINEEDFSWVINEIGAKMGLINHKSTENMNLYFKLEVLNDQTFLLIVSADEVQPGLYKTILEGIWELN